MRRLTSADLKQYLGAQFAAFGQVATLRPDFDLDAGTPFALGEFDGDRLVGKLAAYPFTLTLGGRQVPAHGIADVSVDVALRGRGVGRSLMADLLRAERDRGALLSLLYPSIPAVYRSYGYAAVTARDLVRLDRGSLATARIAPDLTVTRLGPESLDEAYRAVTLGQEGVLSPLPKAGTQHNDLAALRSGRVVGLLRYVRTPTALTADLALATDAEAWRAILAVLASESGDPDVEVWSSPHDPCWHWHPGLPGVTARQTPMLRPLDVSAALEGRGWPQAASGRWRFTVEDRLLPENDGGYEFRLDKGAANVHRLRHPDGPTQSVAEIAALIAGTRRPSDRQWRSLPSDLLAAASLDDWTMVVGF